VGDPTAELLPVPLGDAANAAPSGSDDPAFVRAATTATGGNPFLLDQLLCELGPDRTAAAVATVEPRKLGRSVLAPLDEDARSLARALVIHRRRRDAGRVRRPRADRREDERRRGADGGRRQLYRCVPAAAASLHRGAPSNSRQILEAVDLETCPSPAFPQSDSTSRIERPRTKAPTTSALSASVVRRRFEARDSRLKILVWSVRFRSSPSVPPSRTRDQDGSVTTGSGSCRLAGSSAAELGRSVWRVRPSCARFVILSLR